MPSLYRPPSITCEAIYPQLSLITSYLTYGQSDYACVLLFASIELRQRRQGFSTSSRASSYCEVTICHYKAPIRLPIIYLPILGFKALRAPVKVLGLHAKVITLRIT